MWPLLALGFAAVCLLLFLRLRYLTQTLRDLGASAEARKPYLVATQPVLADHFQIRRIGNALNLLLSENARSTRAEKDHLRQIETTLRSIQEAVVIIDAQNQVVAANTAFTDRFGEGADPTGRRIESLLPGPAFLEYVRETQSGTPPPRRELQATVGHRPVTWFEVSGATLEADLTEEDASSENENLVLFVLHDITRQKQLESIRSEFIANVSHELRTPLTVLKGFADTLVEDHTQLSDADRERFLLKVKRHVERLTLLVEDLLALSRLEASPDSVQKQPESLPRLIQELTDDYHHRPNPRGHTIETQIAPAIGEISLDRMRIHQVFENLLDNAFKYCREPARIVVGARISADGILCFVEDDGPGIPEEDIPRVFERFYRVDKGRSRESGGTGLGLAIVKHIVQQHGGTVRCKSRQGEGTRFEFVLPLQSDQLPVSEPDPVARTPAAH